MTIFGENRLGRLAYALILLAMFGFDFAKGPIERFLVHQQDRARAEMMTPRPVGETTAETHGQVNGKQMPLMFKAQEDAIREIANAKQKPSREEMERRLMAATLKGVATMETNAPANPEVAKAYADSTFYGIAFFAAVIAMTGVTIVGLLYAVSGRLRDIGWSQGLLWVMIAPVFLPKLLGIPLPALALQGVSLFFYAILFALAFIPGPSDDTADPVERVSGPSPVIKRRPGQFGKLGTL